MTFKEFKQMIEDRNALDRQESAADLRRIRLENDPFYDCDDAKSGCALMTALPVSDASNHDFF